MDIEELKKLHDKAYTENQQTREQAADDLVFYYVTQWDDQLLNGSQLQFRGEFNVLNKAGRQVMADVNANPVSVDFEPVDEDREDAAELMDGLYRTTERENTSIEAFNNAVNEAIVCGFGAWEVYSTYKTLRNGNDQQVIRRKPIYEANNNVFFDPNAKLLDKSDATYVSVLQAYTVDGYEILHEELTGEDADPVTPESFGAPEQSYTFPWFTGNKHVYIARFYHKNKVKDKVFTMIDPLGQELVVRESDLAEIMDDMLDAAYQIIDTKEIERFEVTQYIASGREILKEEVIAGESLPIIPTYGERAYIEDQEVYRGITRLAKDPQRLRNFQMSYLADIVSRSPRNKPIFLPEQIQGFEYMYEESGSDNNYSYLLQNRKTVDGQELPIGAAGELPEQRMPQALGAMIELSKSAIEDVANPGLPQDLADPDLSGKAVVALQNRIDMQSMIYQDNLKHAKRWDGVVYSQIASEVIDTPRDVKLTLPDGRAKTVKIMQSIVDKETGEPKVINDLSGLEFDVYSDIGPSYSTMKQQSREELISLMGMTDPNDPMRNILMLKYVKLMDGSEFKDVRDYANKQLLIQGIREPETPEEQKMLMSLQQQQKEPDAMTLAAQAEIKKAEADMADVQRQAAKDQSEHEYKQGKNQIDLFKASTDRMDLQVKAQEAGVNIKNTQAKTVGQKLENVERLRARI